MYHVLSRQACLFLYKTLRRHSMSAVATQSTLSSLFLLSGVILPPRLPGGAGVHEGLRSSDGDCIPLLSAPIQQILRDRGDHGTLSPQMVPEETYSQFRSAIPGILLSMSAALRVTHFRWRTFPRSTTRDYKFVRGQGGSLYSRITDGD